MSEIYYEQSSNFYSDGTLHEDVIKRYEIERKENWEKIQYKIPYLKFKEEYNVRIIPPFGQAIVRFLVTLNENSVSVYLDFYGKLGYMHEPYWEIYHVTGNKSEDNAPSRFLLNDTESMMSEIDMLLRK